MTKIIVVLFIVINLVTFTNKSSTYKPIVTVSCTLTNVGDTCSFHN